MTMRCAHMVTGRLHEAKDGFGTTGTVSGDAKATENTINA